MLSRAAFVPRRFAARVLVTPALALLVLAWLAPAARASAFRLPALFSSNMVLQRGRPSTFWGQGAPGTQVSLVPSWGAPVATPVRPDGSWRLSFTPPKGPGPYQIEVRAADTLVTIRNVLVGEVWLCSGQSNMEMPLAGWPPDAPVAGADSAIAAADYPSVRLFTVTKDYSTTPESSYAGQWAECTPATARLFSATGFFFGRRIASELNVPVGLVHSSWGGTPVEAWTSRPALAAFPEFREPLAWVAVGRESLASLDRWLHRHRVIELKDGAAGKGWEDLELGDEGCAARDADESRFQPIDVPGDWENKGLGDLDGVVWYRKRAEIPAAWIGRPLTLRLGPVDDMDLTYVNGRLVGGMMGLDHWRTPRVYTVPESLVRDRVIQIAVRVVDFGGGGGLWGDGRPIDLFAGDSAQAIPLAGAWKVLPVAEFHPPSLYAFGGPLNDYAARPRLPIEIDARTPTVLYNGMIGPLAPFSIRGAIWYQGEENVRRAGAYRKLFAAMIADWRRTFAQGDFPFFFTQIAPYAYDAGVNSQDLREAQRLSMSLPNTGMAVTLDVGEAHNIHPAHKREVGERLAAWALAKTYGRRVPYSGPLYRAMTRGLGAITLAFDCVEGGLVLRDTAAGSGFEIAGADGKFVDADVTVRGSTLVVSSPRVSAPIAVRYAFSDTPRATLFNSAGLPAPSFTTGAPSAGAPAK